MMRIVKPLSTILMAVWCLSPLAHSATVLGKVYLMNTPHKHFGTLHFAFHFQTQMLFALCEFGVDPAGPQCVNNVVSDYVCVTTDAFGQGVVAMVSDPGSPTGVQLPPGFPCAADVPTKFLNETGGPQTLSPAGGFATLNPDDTAGPFIKINAKSALAASPESDILTVLAF